MSRSSPSVRWSPRVRGWSLPRLRRVRRVRVVPARAGVVPGSTSARRTRSRGPRACGGGPPGTLPDRSHPAVPAHAGVVPARHEHLAEGSGGPRTRGGGPALEDHHPVRRTWSPRTRGWSLVLLVGQLDGRVVPAHAGMAHALVEGAAPAECRRVVRVLLYAAGHPFFLFVSHQGPGETAAISPGWVAEQARHQNAGPGGTRGGDTRPPKVAGNPEPDVASQRVRLGTVGSTEADSVRRCCVPGW